MTRLKSVRSSGPTPSLGRETTGAGVACATAVMASVPGALLAGAQRWRDASIVGLIAVLVVTPTTVLVLSLGGGIVGLFAAIPAVIAYNRFSHGVNRVEAGLNRFADEFHATLSRQLDGAR